MKTTLHAEDFIPTRYSLLSRLQNWEDQESWKDFFDTYWRVIYAVARKSGLSDSEAQDVVQETIISVAKNIQKFKRDPKLGSFKGWLRNLTRWRIIDQVRKRTNPAAEPIDYANDNDYPQDMAEIPDSAEAGAVWEDEWRVNLMNVAVENVKKTAKEEHFQMFDLYVIKHWPAVKVAEALEVTVGQVYLAKFRIGALVKKEVRRLENSEITIM